MSGEARVGLRKLGERRPELYAPLADASGPRFAAAQRKRQARDSGADKARRVPLGMRRCGTSARARIAASPAPRKPTCPRPFPVSLSQGHYILLTISSPTAASTRCPMSMSSSVTSESFFGRFARLDRRHRIATRITTYEIYSILSKATVVNDFLQG
jgi:hypothetical protein